MYCYTKWLLNVKIFQVISGGRYFGSKHITNTQLSKINDSSVLKLTCDLLSLIYEKTELRNSSLTGYVAYANKSLNLDKKSTEKLDPVRLNPHSKKKSQLYYNDIKCDDQICHKDITTKSWRHANVRLITNVMSQWHCCDMKKML